MCGRSPCSNSSDKNGPDRPFYRTRPAVHDNGGAFFSYIRVCHPWHTLWSRFLKWYTRSARVTPAFGCLKNLSRSASAERLAHPCARQALWYGRPGGVSYHLWQTLRSRFSLCETHGVRFTSAAGRDENLSHPQGELRERASWFASERGPAWLVYPGIIAARRKSGLASGRFSRRPCPDCFPSVWGCRAFRRRAPRPWRP